MSKKQKTSTKGLRPPKKHRSLQNAKIYWPYLPLFLLLIGGLFINIWQPLQRNKPATLAYATEMSRTALLNATNEQRVAYGSAPLTINEKLNAAAQAKADDMVARDYWAHNTPDGQEPWIFFDAQGYQYTKAGENLAYGFTTSNKTVIGWINSPSHRANLIDTAFLEVGFGFANSDNFVGTSNETIVVAEYGKPYVASGAITTSIQPTPKQAPTPVSAPAPIAPVEKPPTIIEATPNPQSSASSSTPITSDNPVPNNVQSKRITLLQQLTGGRAPWSAIAISLFGIGLASLWLFKHFLGVRKFLVNGEHFISHHPIFDLAVIIIISVAVYLSQSSGIIQ